MAYGATDRTCSETFVTLMGGLAAQTPDDLHPHHIVDSLKTHDTECLHHFLEEHPHAHPHFTLTHVSWLIQAESFFAILERRPPRRRVDSVDHLADRTTVFIKHYNHCAAQFR
ncbi:MAG: hypothetical protein ACRDVP_12035 [Acidimicrobiales bacterium]